MTKTGLAQTAKKIANKVARIARKTAAKAEVAQARQKGVNKYYTGVARKDAKLPAHVRAARVTGDAAGRAKKTELRTAAQAKHEQMVAAKAEHRATTGLPGRNQRFTIPAGGGKPERTYTGKDVRKANFASHIQNSAGNRFGNAFGNSDHQDAGASGTTKPIPGMIGPGHEHPLSGATNFSQMKKGHKNEPARIISQSNAPGHQHMGVIAHDRSRGSILV